MTLDKKEVLRRMNSVFCDVFDDDSLVINEKTTADDIEDWDSLSHITLVAALEREFCVQFDLKEIAKLVDVGGMVELIVRTLDK